MTLTPLYLQNKEAVLNAFGYWPDFHDAHVTAFCFSKESGGKIGLTLHGWEMTNIVDGKGYFKCIKHHLVQFEFHQISDADLDRFISKNILFHLKFSSPEDFSTNRKFKVTMDSAMGGDLCGSFFASVGRVLDVLPCDEKGNKLKSTSA